MDADYLFQRLLTQQLKWKFSVPLHSLLSCMCRLYLVTMISCMVWSDVFELDTNHKSYFLTIFLSCSYGLHLGVFDI